MSRHKRPVVFTYASQRQLTLSTSRFLSKQVKGEKQNQRCCQTISKLTKQTIARAIKQLWTLLEDKSFYLTPLYLYLIDVFKLQQPNVHGRMVSNCASYLWGPGFESRPGDRLSCLRISMTFFSHSKILEDFHEKVVIRSRCLHFYPTSECSSINFANNSSFATCSTQCLSLLGVSFNFCPE